MTQQVTKGIKISIDSRFEGNFFKHLQLKYAFAYQITIENQSNDMVQLKSRFWEIKDALSDVEYVSGEGVIGQKPVLQPGESHTYQSGCLLTAPIGAMSGYYTMTNLENGNDFRVRIPSFKLAATFVLN